MGDEPHFIRVGAQVYFTLLIFVDPAGIGVRAGLQRGPDARFGVTRVNGADYFTNQFVIPLGALDSCTHPCLGFCRLSGPAIMVTLA